MENYGEKRVRFRHDTVPGIGGITFQVTDVAKPLAAVSRFLDKGHSVVFSRGPGGSFIEHDSGRRTPLVEDKGTFFLEVELLEPAAAAGFHRQGHSGL